MLEVLSKMSSLTSLNLENNSNIIRLDIGRFGNRLAELHKLQKLNFNRTQMTSRFLEVLVSIIYDRFHTSLKEISVKDNPNLTAFDIWDLKEKFPNATILSSIESEEMDQASTAINDSKKQHVCIEGLSDSEDDEAKISELRLYHLPKIENLFLKGTNFNSTLFQFIDPYLFGMKNLCKVHLHFDFFEIGILQKFLENINSSLTSLQVGPNLQAVRLSEIKAYKKIGGISKFILPSLRQGQEYISYLEDVLSRMSNLTTLNLKGNYNLIHGLDEMRKIRLGIILVQYLPKLQVLNLEDTVMTNERVSLFIKDTKGLLQNLTKINIANNNLVTKEYIEQLKGAFPQVFIKTQKTPVSKDWVLPTSPSSSEASTSE
ncbi:MAG: hypothetical protein IBJ00_06820 [Alphaproteobacteria bacterium]|nr:hypothetical protein [Alphaproteobacteria bacterium]